MKHNYIVRHETCHFCRKDLPVWQYAYMNADGFTRILVNDSKVAVCPDCWNNRHSDYINVGMVIEFTDKGWEYIPSPKSV